MQNPFQGSHVALATPFRGEQVDVEALRRLVEAHAEAGTDGVVACGTTGEASTLSGDERRLVIETTVAAAAGRLKVMAGVGTNSTTTTVELARETAKLGVDGLLVVTPYYNRPSPAGLDLHFGAVAQAVDLPIVLYNVPSRTGVDLAPTQALALAARHPNVVAIKEASPSRERIPVLCGSPDLDLLCGEDTLIAEFMAAGAAGAVSVTGNVLPGPIARWIQASRPGGDPQESRRLTGELLPVIHAMFVETNPVPVKAALAQLGLCEEAVRPPLACLEPRSRTKLEAALKGIQGLIGAGERGAIRG